MREPAVSVIVPVYNGEKYILPCLESLKNQTLESIEFIVVNHGSTDKTLEVVEAFCEGDERFFIYTIPHEGTLGRVRNYGIEKARGRYLGACDADDYVDVRTYEVMYKKAIENDYDIVCAPVYEVKKDQKVLTRITPNPTVESYLMNGSFAVWNKIIKKDLLIRCGKMREDICYEDVSCIPAVISYAKNIAYVDFPVYYYIQREGSIIHSKKAVKNLDYIEAARHVIKRCKEVHRERVAAFILRGCLRYIKNEWQLSDAFISFIGELYSEYPQSLQYIYSEELRKEIAQLAEIENFIPMKVYVNGFGNKNLDARIIDIKENAFYEKCSVEVLNEETIKTGKDEFIDEVCNKGDYDTAVKYLALKRIYETGGIYISNDLQLVNFLNAVTRYDVFLGYEDTERITDKIFGGKAGNELLRVMLEEYRRRPQEDWNALIVEILRRDTAYRGTGETYIDKHISVFDQSIFIDNSSTKALTCLRG